MTQNRDTDMTDWVDALNQARELIKQYDPSSAVPSSPPSSPRSAASSTALIRGGFGVPKLTPFSQLNFKSYADLKKYVDKLLEQNFTAEKKAFLKKLKSTTEDLLPFENLRIALKLFHQLDFFEEQLKSFNVEIAKNSFLAKELTKPYSHFAKQYKQLQAKLDTFKEQTYECKIILGSYFQQNLKSNFNQFASVKEKFTFKYPVAYRSIAQKKKLVEQPVTHESAVIKKVSALFEDYDKKNSVRFFHWRHHSSEAKRIYRELNALLASNQSPDEKIIAAIKIVLQEEGNAFDKRKMGIERQKESSFFRRAHFAIELLDAERARLSAPQVQVEGSRFRGP